MKRVVIQWASSFTELSLSEQDKGPLWWQDYDKECLSYYTRGRLQSSYDLVNKWISFKKMDSKEFTNNLNDLF